MTTLQERAIEARKHFELAERPSGTKFWRAKSTDKPKWIQDLCREAHGDMLPDDQRYRFIVDALDLLSENDSEEAASELIESDIYTSDLIEWLGSHLDRLGYCDEAITDMGAKDMSSALSGGQYLERCEVLSLVAQGLRTSVSWSEQLS